MHSLSNKSYLRNTFDNTTAETAAKTGAGIKVPVELTEQERWCRGYGQLVMVVQGAASGSKKNRPQKHRTVRKFNSQSRVETGGSPRCLNP